MGESQGQTLGFWKKTMPLSLKNFIPLEKTALDVLLGSYGCAETGCEVTHARET